MAAVVGSNTEPEYSYSCTLKYKCELLVLLCYFIPLLHYIAEGIIVLLFINHPLFQFYFWVK